MRARVSEKREVAKGTLLVLFDLLGEEVDFTPGQYFFVTLLDPPYDDERGGRRHFSVVTSPNERGQLGFCTRLRDSAFKRTLAELPIGSMLRYIAEEELPHRLTLIYSNRDRDSTPFLDELSELEQARGNFQLVLTMTEDPSWNGEARRIDPELLRDYLADDLSSYAYLVAGPPSMVNAITETLQNAGIPEEQVSADRFSGY